MSYATAILKKSINAWYTVEISDIGGGTSYYLATKTVRKTGQIWRGLIQSISRIPCVPGDFSRRISAPRVTVRISDVNNEIIQYLKPYTATTAGCTIRHEVLDSGSVVTKTIFKGLLSSFSVDGSVVSLVFEGRENTMLAKPLRYSEKINSNTYASGYMDNYNGDISRLALVPLAVGAVASPGFSTDIPAGSQMPLIYVDDVTTSGYACIRCIVADHAVTTIDGVKIRTASTTLSTLTYSGTAALTDYFKTTSGTVNSRTVAYVDIKKTLVSTGTTFPLAPFEGYAQLTKSPSVEDAVAAIVADLPVPLNTLTFGEAGMSGIATNLDFLEASASANFRLFADEPAAETLRRICETWNLMCWVDAAAATTVQFLEREFPHRRINKSITDTIEGGDEFVASTRTTIASIFTLSAACEVKGNVIAIYDASNNAATYNITVKDSGGSTIKTINAASSSFPTGGGSVWCFEWDGAAWDITETRFMRTFYTASDQSAATTLNRKNTIKCSVDVAASKRFSPVTCLRFPVVKLNDVGGRFLAEHTPACPSAGNWDNDGEQKTLRAWYGSEGNAVSSTDPTATSRVADCFYERNRRGTVVARILMAHNGFDFDIGDFVNIESSDWYGATMTATYEPTLFRITEKTYDPDSDTVEIIAERTADLVLSA